MVCTSASVDRSAPCVTHMYYRLCSNASSFSHISPGLDGRLATVCVQAPVCGRHVVWCAEASYTGLDSCSPSGTSPSHRSCKHMYRTARRQACIGPSPPRNLRSETSQLNTYGTTWAINRQPGCDSAPSFPTLSRFHTRRGELGTTSWLAIPTTSSVGS